MHYTITKNWGVKSDYVPNLLGSITINMVTFSSCGASHVRVTHDHSAENIIQAVHVVLNSVIYYIRWYFSDDIAIFQILCCAMLWVTTTPPWWAINFKYHQSKKFHGVRSWDRQTYADYSVHDLLIYHLWNVIVRTAILLPQYGERVPCNTKCISIRQNKAFVPFEELRKTATSVDIFVQKAKKLQSLLTVNPKTTKDREWSLQ